jgi:predicted O-methyltransferase YrrM
LQSAVTITEAAELARLAAGCVVLELGAFYGYTTIVMASVAEKVYSIDWHKGDDQAGDYQTWDGYKANLVGYKVDDRVVAIRGRFEEEVPKLAANGVRVDGAFLDGHHTAEDVQRDLDLALMLIRPGGWCAFHDYGRSGATGHPGFAVTEVADRFGVTDVIGCLAWGTVPDEPPA